MRRIAVFLASAALILSMLPAEAFARGFGGGGFGGGGFRGGGFGGGGFRGFGGGGFRSFGGGGFRNFGGGGFRGVTRFGGIRFNGRHFNGRHVVGRQFVGGKLAHANPRFAGTRHVRNQLALGLVAGGALHHAHGFNSARLGHNAFGNQIAWRGWNARWKHWHGGWFGPVIWPFLYGDVWSFAFWPYDYYDAFWDYDLELDRKQYLLAWASARHLRDQ